MFAGSHIGTLATLPVSAFVMEHYGWRSIFLLLGCFGLAYSASVMFFVTADPSQHTSIHTSELKRIKAGTPPLDETTRPIPWGRIFRSGACWALFFGHVANNWGTYLMLTQVSKRNPRPQAPIPKPWVSKLVPDARANVSLQNPSIPSPKR